MDGYEIGRRLSEAGLIPDQVRRIVIDIPTSSAVTIYYETLADEKTIDLVLEELKHPKELRIKKVGDADNS